jgi:hypothetical protein
MKANIYISIFLSFAIQTIAGQNTPDLKNGYALKGSDTIGCKVRMNSKQDHGSAAITLMIDGEEARFYPGGPISGFGYEKDGEMQHFGTVDVEVSVPSKTMSNLYFVRKIVAGIIDLYQYEYSVTTSKRTTVNGVEKPGSATSTSQRFSNHYIAKTDPSAPHLATPVLLPAFRKKDLEPFFSDNPALLANADKRLSQKELIELLNAYNSWYIKNK